MRGAEDEDQTVERKDKWKWNISETGGKGGREIAQRGVTGVSTGITMV